MIFSVDQLFMGSKIFALNLWTSIMMIVMIMMIMMTKIYLPEISVDVSQVVEAGLAGATAVTRKTGQRVLIILLSTSFYRHHHFIIIVIIPSYHHRHHYHLIIIINVMKLVWLEQPLSPGKLGRESSSFYRHRHHVFIIILLSLPFHHHHHLHDYHLNHDY